METGRTFTEEWESREVDGRRALLMSAGAGGVVHRAAVPGRKTFDESRIALHLDTFADPEAQRLAEIAAEEAS